MTTFNVLNSDDDGAGSLRNTIVDANSNPGLDTITFSKDLAGQTITLSTGTLSISESLIIDGDLDDDGNPDITIDANGGSRVFNVNDGDNGVFQDVTLGGLVITGGQVYGQGGGIDNAENLILSDTIVSGNTTAEPLGHGGGIFSSTGDLILDNSTVSGNTTTGALSDGGGIAISEGALTLNNSTVSDNSTAGSRSYGGGVFGFSSELILNDSSVSGNATRGTNNSEGGGIAIYSGTLTLNRTTISGNATIGSLGYGGGISNTFGTLILNNSTVSGNSAVGLLGAGGGISSAGEAILNNSTVSGNSTTGLSGHGGGISSIRGELTLNNSTISGNSTSGHLSDGGGIFGFDSNLHLNNTTVSGNFTVGDYADGGGIASLAGMLRLRSNLVTGNWVAVAVGDEIASTYMVDSDGSNLFGDASKTNAQAFADFSPEPGDIDASSDGTDPTVLEDILSPLADNGGETRTHALPPGSPALDTGANAQNFFTDQRGAGFIRTAGTGTDIGAFELQDGGGEPPPIAVPTLYGGTSLMLAVLLGALAIWCHRQHR